MNSVFSLRLFSISILSVSLMACGTGDGSLQLTTTTTTTNESPVALDQSTTTNNNTAVDITLSGTDADGDDLTYAITSNPQAGTLSGVIPQLTYTPDANFVGDDDFSFTVNDGVLTSNAATVAITVKTISESTIVDSTPDAFAFTNLSGVLANAVVVANAVVISGINTLAKVEITNGEYSIDGATYTATEGVINNQQSIRVRLTASPVALEAVEARVIIGGVTGIFKVTTRGNTAITSAWKDMDAQVSIETSNPIRTQDSPDARVIIEITNTSSELLSGPLRLVLEDITPNTVSLRGESGMTAENNPYLDLSPFIGDGIAPGGSTGPITLTLLGGRTTFSFVPRVEQKRVENILLGVDINSPATLITVGSSPLQVSGNISDPNALLTVNGIPVNHRNNQFSAAVSLAEGNNTIVVRAVNVAGNEVTDSIVVSMDTTPPYVTIDAPRDGATVSTERIAVSGLINDIVRGTISENQANVVVNGISATVANRTYLAENVPLVEGRNEIVISASDNVGNTAHNSIVVFYELPAPKHIQLDAGQNQSAPISEILVSTLAVKLIGSDGVSPAPNKVVIFRVVQGDGIVAPGTEDESQAVLVTSDANGIAQTSFKLGQRAGSGNHKVRARAVGFDSEVIFYASATPKSGNKVSVNSGNNQRGGINQPLPQPFIVAISDEGANLVQGAQIEFKVTRGGGLFQNGQETLIATTDSDGRASAHMTLGPDAGLDVHRVTATLVGTTLKAGFTASGLIPGDPGQTRISGLVFDNQDNPLPGVTVRVDGTNRQAVVNAQGQFTIDGVPVGPVHLLVDGSTTDVVGEWPTLSYNIVTVAGADNPLAAPIYLVKLNMANAVLAGNADVEISLAEVPGFKLTVLADSVTFPDGAREGLISVTPVNVAKIPMAPPNGMQPQFIVTIQPAGAMFDPPAPLTLPNVDGHAPGAQVEMYSYDHDLEEFVAIGLGTVSVDGRLIDSNLGVGVIKAGWHCGSQPSGSGCANSCGECKECNGNCNCVDDNSETPTSISDTPNDCKKPVCRGGAATQITDNEDLSAEDAKCKQCALGRLENKPDDSRYQAEPSEAPAPTYTSERLFADDGGLIAGVTDLNISMQASCSVACVDGEEKYALEGDVLPGPNSAVVISKAFPEIENCLVRGERTWPNVQNTVGHEFIHRDALMNVINSAKSKFGTLYDSSLECFRASQELLSEIETDWLLETIRQARHEDPAFDGDNGASFSCVDGYVVEDEIF